MIVFPIGVLSHSSLLDIEYDECDDDDSDGEDEAWYFLSKIYKENDIYIHIPHYINTIKYYFANSAFNDSDYRWNTDVTNDVANEIRTAFANSMMKWNNVRFYYYNEYGNRTEVQLINVVEGTSTNNDIIIYPIENESILDYEPFTSIARTEPYDSETSISTGSSNISHFHYSKWRMFVNVHFFYEHDDVSLALSNYSREAVGEHELGHVLGLRDADVCCSLNPDHHEELLMGYGSTLNRVQNATYKDIAGVAITRGFHTDNDHIWMKRDNGDSIDMICAICNGVKYNVELDSGGLTYQGKTFTEFEDCIHHGHTNSNMLLVAKDNNRYFFKCMYCRHIDTIKIEDTLHVYNTTQPVTSDINIEARTSKYYRLNIHSDKYHEIKAIGTSGVNIELYDENYNEISIEDVSYSSTINHIIKYLDSGIYYLKINNPSYRSNNNVSFEIISNNSQYLSIDENDILINAYNGISEYNYYNESGPGFYKFKISASNIDGTTYYYQAGALKIYNDSSRSTSSIMNKYDYDTYNNRGTNQAINKYNEDYIIVYLPSNGYYYLDIDVSSINLASLSIEISSLSIDELDLFDLSENSNDDAFEFHENDYGDNFIKLNIKQAGYFKITASYDGDLSPYILVLVIKITYDEDLHSYVRDEKLKEEFNKNDSQASVQKDLEEGIYYIGYLNKTDNYYTSISLQRIITESGSSHLVADAIDYDDYGSEVRFNNGLRGGTTLTVGFTRFIYLDDPSNVPSISRLNYYWYTSNEEVAIISEYGTLLAKSPGTVKVMAVYKSNPSITYVKEFTVLADNRINDLIIYDTDSVSYTSSNQLYQIELDDYNSYFPQISLYNWNILSSTNNYTISEWGTFYLSGNDTIVIEATSKLNSKLKIRITLTVMI